jgi:hypothetical protein
MYKKSSKVRKIHKKQIFFMRTVIIIETSQSDDLHNKNLRDFLFSEEFEKLFSKKGRRGILDKIKLKNKGKGKKKNNNKKKGNKTKKGVAKMSAKKNK